MSAIRQAVDPILRTLLFYTQSYTGPARTNLDYTSLDTEFFVTVECYDALDMGTVHVYRTTPRKRLRSIFISSTNAKETEFIELLRHNDYGPAVALHRQRMLNLLVD